MKTLAAKFLVVIACCWLGERLIAASLQWGEDRGLGVWGVVQQSFDYSLYPLDRIGTLMALGAIVLLSDFIPPGRLKLFGLGAVSAFVGAYCYVMFFSYNEYESFDRAYEWTTKQYPGLGGEILGWAFSLAPVAVVFLAAPALKLALKVVRPTRTPSAG